MMSLKIQKGTNGENQIRLSIWHYYFIHCIYLISYYSSDWNSVEFKSKIMDFDTDQCIAIIYFDTLSLALLHATRHIVISASLHIKSRHQFFNNQHSIARYIYNYWNIESLHISFSSFKSDCRQTVRKRDYFKYTYTVFCHFPAFSQYTRDTRDSYELFKSQKKNVKMQNGSSDVRSSLYLNLKVWN